MGEVERPEILDFVERSAELNPAHQHLPVPWHVPPLEGGPGQRVGEAVLEHGPCQVNGLGDGRPEHGIGARVDHLEVVLVLTQPPLDGAVQHLDGTARRPAARDVFIVVVVGLIAPEFIHVRLARGRVDLGTQHGDGIGHDAHLIPPNPLRSSGVSEEVLGHIGRLRPRALGGVGDDAVPVQAPDGGPDVLVDGQGARHHIEQLGPTLHAILGQLADPNLIAVDAAGPMQHRRPLQVRPVGALGPVHVEVRRGGAGRIGGPGVGHPPHIAAVEGGDVVVLDGVGHVAERVGPTQLGGVLDGGQHGLDGS